MYNCATSDEYYSKVIFKLGSKSAISRLCSEDPRNYQSCGLAASNRIINSDILCDEVLCHSPEDKLAFSHPLLQKCMQVSAHEDTPSICKPHLDYNSCLNVSTALYLEDSVLYHEETATECDMMCQNSITCIDEAVCNGFTYGLFCLQNGRRSYLKTSKICDMSSDCDDLSDELHCLKNIYETGSCVKYESVTVFPIANFTRCGPLEISPSGRKYSYCKNFIDQFNCSDPLRAVVSCNVGGFPSTVSMAVLCMEGSTLCDDGLDTLCKKTSPTCFVHKHLLCDGVEDCKDGTDERVSSCDSVLEAKCFRRSV